MQKRLAEIFNILQSDLTHLLGEKLEVVYLYGSQARGDAHPDSDIDILIVLRDEFNYFEMIEKTSYITSTISLNFDVVISCTFVSKDEYDNMRTPFLINVRREGILV